MTTLDPKAGYVILINTFTVEPSKAEDLGSALSRATENGMRQRPGFVSANLHVSLDKRHVTNYAQWRSQEDLDTMMKDPAARAHMQEIGAWPYPSIQSITSCANPTRLRKSSEKLWVGVASGRAVRCLHANCRRLVLQHVAFVP